MHIKRKRILQYLSSGVELEPLDVVLPEQHPRALALPDLAAHRAQLLVEGGSLLALALPLVQHLGERLEGGEGQLQGHPVHVAGRGLLEKVLEQEDELGEPLDRLHHQSEEVQSVVGCYLLHLEKNIISLILAGFLTFDLLELPANSKSLC